MEPIFQLDHLPNHAKYVCPSPLLVQCFMRHFKAIWAEPTAMWVVPSLPVLRVSPPHGEA